MIVFVGSVRSGPRSSLSFTQDPSACSVNPAAVNACFSLSFLMASAAFSAANFVSTRVFNVAIFLVGSVGSFSIDGSLSDASFNALMRSSMNESNVMDFSGVPSFAASTNALCWFFNDFTWVPSSGVFLTSTPVNPPLNLERISRGSIMSFK